MTKPTCALEAPSARASYEDLIAKYRAILAGNRDCGDHLTTINGLLGLLEGPDWRVAAELRHAALGLELNDREALVRALSRKGAMLDRATAH